LEKDWENHPFSFTPLGLGGGLWQGGQKIHLDARIRLLQRAKLRSPPLPAYLEAEWPKIRDTYAKLAGENLGSKVGQALVDGVVHMSDLLGQHYNHPDKHKKKSKGGDKTAFEKYVVSLKNAWGGGPKAASSVVA
jgi:hypothetical protein